MTQQQRLQNLFVPAGPVDVVLDTDAFNEIDDQFAIAYLLRSKEKLNTLALYAAPFYNAHSENPKDGMEKSYLEIQKILKFMNETVDVFKGSETYLPDEHTPVLSPAAADLVEKAKKYSPERPLYVVAIGAITNVASALLIEPKIADNIVVVWLGGHAHHYSDTKEFNMRQDVAAARVVMGCGVPFVQLPCMGVVSSFTISQPELERWFLGKTPISNYLGGNTIEEVRRWNSSADRFPWTRVIWDVTAVAWLLNDDNRFMLTRKIPTPVPTYDNRYAANPDGSLMEYVYHIRRDELWADVIEKLTAC